MSEATQTQTLEETLNKTDLGHVLYEHRKSIFYVIVSVLLVILGWIFWKETKTSSAMNQSLMVFEFQNKVWADVKTNKLSAAELVKSFNQLDADVQTAPVMVPVVLEMGKYLYEKGSYEEAAQILSKLDGKLTHPVSAFFVGTQYAVILEKLNRIDDAILTLENLLKNKDMFMKPKLALELGRLYLGKNEKGKAQTQFDYVVSNFPNDELAKLAKLYLAKLAQ